VGVTETVGVAGRIIGRYDAGRHGPTVVVVAALHGNEPAGLAAAQAVVARLVDAQLPLRGRFVAVAGNLAALATRERYVDRDLNRLWSREEVDRARTADPGGDDHEGVERRALLGIFDELLADPRTDPVVLDLHSTSASGGPFSCISDTLRSRALALATGVPLVLGLEEAIRGTLLEYLEELGHPLILIEGGQHDDPATAAVLEAAVWEALLTLGCLCAEEVPHLATHRARIVVSAGRLPRVVEVLYRHAIGPADGFRMRTGFANFTPVRRGEIVADDRRGPVTAPVSGLLLMPLYQPLGADGFFIGRPVRRTWLSVSTLFRAARVDRLLPHLPGVAHDPDRPQRLLVNPRVARFVPVQLFHLSGYRRLPSRGGRLVFTRRVEP
jgi:hypothetical protein